MKKITILIAEDHALYRETIASMIDKDGRFLIVGKTGNGVDAVLLSLRLNPDLVIMDIKLEGIDGIEATRRIKSKAPDIKIIGVSLYDDPFNQEKIVKSGAYCYLSKNSPMEELFSAIIQAANGEGFMNK